ncbi:MAG: YfiR family protein [Bacteroidota bacterium]
MKPKSILVTAFICLFSMTAMAQADDEINAYKGMFVYNFIRYIQWPNNTENIQIGIVGSDEKILSAFGKLAKSKSPTGQQIIIKQVTPEESSNCNMLFISAKVSNGDILSIINQLKDLPIVVITDDENWIKKGAFLSFKIHGGKLRFQINKEAFDRTKMKVSSALLSMAI